MLVPKLTFYVPKWTVPIFRMYRKWLYRYWHSRYRNRLYRKNMYRKCMYRNCHVPKATYPGLGRFGFFNFGSIRFGFQSQVLGFGFLGFGICIPSQCNNSILVCENTKTESRYFDGKFSISTDHAQCEGFILHTRCGQLLHTRCSRYVRWSVTGVENFSHSAIRIPQNTLPFVWAKTISSLASPKCLHLNDCFHSKLTFPFPILLRKPLFSHFTIKFNIELQNVKYFVYILYHRLCVRTIDKNISK